MAEHPDPLVALLHKHGIGCHPTAERGDFRHHEAAAFWLRDGGAGPLDLDDLATVICHREHRAGMVWCRRHRDEAEGIVADMTRLRRNR